MSTENSSHSSGIIEAADDEENKADTAGDNKKDKKKKKEKKKKNGGEKNHEACRVPVIDSPSDWYKLYGIYPAVQLKAAEKIYGLTRTEYLQKSTTELQVWREAFGKNDPAQLTPGQKAVFKNKAKLNKQVRKALAQLPQFEYDKDDVESLDAETKERILKAKTEKDNLKLQLRYIDHKLERNPRKKGSPVPQVEGMIATRLTERFIVHEEVLEEWVRTDWLDGSFHRSWEKQDHPLIDLHGKLVEINRIKKFLADSAKYAHVLTGQATGGEDQVGTLEGKEQHDNEVEILAVKSLLAPSVEPVTEAVNQLDGDEVQVLDMASTSNLATTILPPPSTTAAMSSTYAASGQNPEIPVVRTKSKKKRGNKSKKTSPDEPPSSLTNPNDRYSEPMKRLYFPGLLAPNTFSAAPAMTESQRLKTQAYIRRCLENHVETVNGRPSSLRYVAKKKLQDAGLEPRWLPTSNIVVGDTIVRRMARFCPLSGRGSEQIVNADVPVLWTSYYGCIKQIKDLLIKEVLLHATEKMRQKECSILFFAGNDFLKDEKPEEMWDTLCNTVQGVLEFNMEHSTKHRVWFAEIIYPLHATTETHRKVALMNTVIARINFHVLQARPVRPWRMTTTNKNGHPDHQICLDGVGQLFSVARAFDAVNRLTDHTLHKIVQQIKKYFRLGPFLDKVAWEEAKTSGRIIPPKLIYSDENGGGGRDVGLPGPDPSPYSSMLGLLYQRAYNSRQSTPGLLIPLPSLELPVLATKPRIVTARRAKEIDDAKQATLELQAKIEAVRGLNDVTRLQFDKILAPSTVCPRKSAASSSSTSSDCNGPISGALGLLASCYDEDEDETERSSEQLVKTPSKKSQIPSLMPIKPKPLPLMSLAVETPASCVVKQGIQNHSAGLDEKADIEIVKQVTRIAAREVQENFKDSETKIEKKTKGKKGKKNKKVHDQSGVENINAQKEVENTQQKVVLRNQNMAELSVTAKNPRLVKQWQENELERFITEVDSIVDVQQQHKNALAHPPQPVPPQQNFPNAESSNFSMAIPPLLWRDNFEKPPPPMEESSVSAIQQPPLGKSVVTDVPLPQEGESNSPEILPALSHGIIGMLDIPMPAAAEKTSLSDKLLTDKSGLSDIPMPVEEKPILSDIPLPDNSNLSDIPLPPIATSGLSDIPLPLADQPLLPPPIESLDLINIEVKKDELTDTVVDSDNETSENNFLDSLPIVFEPADMDGNPLACTLACWIKNSFSPQLIEMAENVIAYVRYIFLFPNAVIDCVNHVLAFVLTAMKPPVVDSSPADIAAVIENLLASFKLDDEGRLQIAKMFDYVRDNISSALPEKDPTQAQTPILSPQQPQEKLFSSKAHLKTGFCSFSLPPPVKSSKEPSKSPKKTSSAPNKAKSYQPLVSAKSTKPKKTACKVSGTGRSGSSSMCFCYNCVTSKDKNSPNVTSKKGTNIFMTGPYQSQAAVDDDIVILSDDMRTRQRGNDLGQNKNVLKSVEERKDGLFQAQLQALSWLSGKAVEPMMPKQQPQQTKEDEVLVEFGQPVPAGREFVAGHQVVGNLESRTINMREDDEKHNGGRHIDRERSHVAKYNGLRHDNNKDDHFGSGRNNKVVDASSMEEKIRQEYEDKLQLMKVQLERQSLELVKQQLYSLRERNSGTEQRLKEDLNQHEIEETRVVRRLASPRTSPRSASPSPHPSRPPDRVSAYKRLRPLSPKQSLEAKRIRSRSREDGQGREGRHSRDQGGNGDRRRDDRSRDDQSRHKRYSSLKTERLFDESSLTTSSSSSRASFRDQHASRDGERSVKRERSAKRDRSRSRSRIRAREQSPGHRKWSPVSKQGSLDKESRVKGSDSLNHRRRDERNSSDFRTDKLAGGHDRKNCETSPPRRKVVLRSPDRRRGQQDIELPPFPRPPITTSTMTYQPRQSTETSQLNRRRLLTTTQSTPSTRNDDDGRNGYLAQEDINSLFNRKSVARQQLTGPAWEKDDIGTQNYENNKNGPSSVDRSRRLKLPDDMADNRQSEDGAAKNWAAVCKYYPNCWNGVSCPFYHPGEKGSKMCKHYPNCKKENSCNFYHPPASVQADERESEYAERMASVKRAEDILWERKQVKRTQDQIWERNQVKRTHDQIWDREPVWGGGSATETRGFGCLR